jgi:basic amino acid/polyamine antiporter, APA family
MTLIEGHHGAPEGAPLRGSLATEIKKPFPASGELVKGLGLTSATMLVMGSMIGSGIFIVSADIARLVDSPALLIGAWLVTGFMTIVGALSYGELAAMMPRAGGQYVYLREALGPLWGFLYGWTLFLVIQTGTIAAVGVAFGKFLGVFFPSVSSSHWLIAPLARAAHPDRPHGPGQHGCRPEHRRTWPRSSSSFALRYQYFRRQDRGGGAERLSPPPRARAARPGAAGLFVGRNARRLPPTSGANFWRNAGWHALHTRSGRRRRPVALVGTLTVRRGAGRFAVFRRRLEQRHLHRRRGQESEAQSAALPGIRHGRGHPALRAGATSSTSRAAAPWRCRTAPPFWPAASVRLPKIASPPPS